MIEQLAANWWIPALGALVLALLAAWLLLGTRKNRVTITRRDALDEGAAPARRNQALIDAPARPADLPPAPPPAAPPADGDDLTRIKGLGPKLAALLASLGVTSFAQIAGWSEAEIDAIDAQLGGFQGRIRRDNWVEQAKFLSSGDMTGFEGKFGKL